MFAGGGEVFKALAMGARAVCMEAGVETAIDLVRTELPKLAGLAPPEIPELGPRVFQFPAGRGEIGALSLGACVKSGAASPKR